MNQAKKQIPIRSLEFSAAFSQLSKQEQLYTYFFYRASWEGCPIVQFNISKESPAIFVVLQYFFSSFDSFDSLKQIVINATSEEEFDQFIEYACKFYSNIGNYNSFGFNKILPIGITIDSFDKILALSPSKDKISGVWNRVRETVFDDDKNCMIIQLEEKGGKNNYYLNGITEEEINKVDTFLLQQKINPLNTRLIKLAENKFAFLVGSVETKIRRFDGEDWIIGYYGDFNRFLNILTENLEKARDYAANDIQRDMLTKYIESFTTGSVEAHKDSQRLWVKDLKPVVETNIGWIETYIDPIGVRGYYEGLVALTDKENSKKFTNLVNLAPKVIATLPWEAHFENFPFKEPDFTALDVVCFASDGCPIGINIPNYDDIREEIGFKNVSLSNAYPSFKSLSYSRFLSDEDITKLQEFGQNSYIIQVACHELLGHGTGKLLRVDEKAKLTLN